MDGLNLYRAGGEAETEAAVPTDHAGDAALSRRAYLNPTVLIVMGSIGTALLTAGVILLICGRRIRTAGE